VARAAIDHRRTEGVTPVDDAVEVDRADPSPVVQGHIREVTRHPDAGVVHEDVEDAVLAMDVLRERRDRRRIADVDGERLRFPRAGFAAGGGRLLGPPEVDVRTQHACALARERDRRRAADPAGRAGDEDERTAEIALHDALLVVTA
jgi:hypothetical protein